MTCAHGFIGACAECDGSGQYPQPFDEHASDLDAWRADQERLNRAYDAALSSLSTAMDRIGPKCPVPARVQPARSCAAPGPYRSALDSPGDPAPGDILPERSAARDSWTLDRMAELMSGKEWSPDTLDELAELLRSTGREC